MSSVSTEQQQEIEARRFIFGLYAFAFSSPRVQKLAEVLVSLDKLAAVRLASEIDSAIGAARAEKLLKTISSHSAAAPEPRSRQTKKGQQKLKHEHETNEL